MTQSLITSNTYSVTVDYTRSLPQMIAAGGYYYANGDITAEHFPVTGEGKKDLEVVLVHFNREMESDNVLAEFDKLGLRAVTLSELLAFGETHPDIQRYVPIIALGSVWQDAGGSRDVPYLDYWGGERELYLNWFVARWGVHCRFAAVKK